MSGNWDDSDDDWDKSDDELDARLNLLNKPAAPAPAVDDEEEDLAVVEKARMEKVKTASLREKGKARAAKQQAEDDRKEEEELARKAMELEAEMEANMTIDERRALERKRVEDSDNALADDLFGAVEGVRSGPVKGQAAGDTVVMKDLKDHLKHARKVAQCMKKNAKIHLATSFFKECIQESKDVLDDDAIAEIIKICNVIKNEKVQAAKRKVKGQAQKSKKKDKAAEAKAKKLAEELYGKNDNYDNYDEYGAAYEDDFF
jgi:translation initiation factor 3 subunit J